jgi:hypothetical protein
MLQGLKQCTIYFALLESEKMISLSKIIEKRSF